MKLLNGKEQQLVHIGVLQDISPGWDKAVTLGLELVLEHIHFDCLITIN